MSNTRKIYRLNLDPESVGSEYEKICEEDIAKMNFALEAIGAAKGWGNNPRWDLLFEAGLKQLLNE